MGTEEGGKTECRHTDTSKKSQTKGRGGRVYPHCTNGGSTVWTVGKQGGGREKRSRLEKDKGGKGPRAASQAGAQDHGRTQMIHRGDDENIIELN